MFVDRREAIQRAGDVRCGPDSAGLQTSTVNEGKIYDDDGVWGQTCILISLNCVRIAFSVSSCRHMCVDMCRRLAFALWCVYRTDFNRRGEVEIRPGDFLLLEWSDSLLCSEEEKEAFLTHVAHPTVSDTSSADYHGRKKILRKREGRLCPKTTFRLKDEAFMLTTQRIWLKIW